jgi:type II secretory pathway pseudopilin PulG
VKRLAQPSVLARAVRQGLTGAAPAGYTLIEVLLGVMALSVLTSAGFGIYRASANRADVRTEQANIQTMAARADRLFGALGSYAGLTTQQAIVARVPPASMLAGEGLLSRWAQPVLLGPASITDDFGYTKPNAALRIVYQGVPARACARLAQAASAGMYDLEVGEVSVFRHSATGQPLDLDRAASIARCRGGGDMAFIYYGGASGLMASVKQPVSLPPLVPPGVSPPSAPPAAPPVAPPPPPSPGCVGSSAPTTPPTGTTPPGQTCSFAWAPGAYPSCWTSQAMCLPIVPPVVPPPLAPPVAPPPPSSPPLPPGSNDLCVPPAAWTETGSQTGLCASGTLTPGGSATFTQTRTRPVSYACPDPFADQATRSNGPWTAWMPTPATTCAPVCVAPAPITQTQAGPAQSRVFNETQAGPDQFMAGAANTRAPNCPAGQFGQFAQSQSTTIWRTTTQTRSTPQTRTTTQTRTVSYSCLAPTGAATASYSPWSAAGAPYGAWSPVPGAWSAPGAPYGPWSAPGAPLGMWTTTVNTCANCPAPSTQTQDDWEGRSQACPSGQEGSHTWEEVRRHTRPVSYSCPAGTTTLPPATYGAWSPWAWTNTRRNEVDTCAPVCASAPGATPTVVAFAMACTLNSSAGGTGVPYPSTATVKAATPAGATITTQYAGGSTANAWNCVSTKTNNPTLTTSGSANTFSNQSYVYMEVSWNGTAYAGWNSIITGNNDFCYTSGTYNTGQGMGCYAYGGTFPPGKALFNQANVPSTVHSSITSYLCP